MESGNISMTLVHISLTLPGLKAPLVHSARFCEVMKWQSLGWTFAKGIGGCKSLDTWQAAAASSCYLNFPSYHSFTISYSVSVGAAAQYCTNHTSSLFACNKLETTHRELIWNKIIDPNKIQLHYSCYKSCSSYKLEHSRLFIEGSHPVCQCSLYYLVIFTLSSNYLYRYLY